MAHSINFNDVDLSAYKLVVATTGVNFLRQLVKHIQLQDRGYALKPLRVPRTITMGCSVTGTTRANLDNNLDNIRRILTSLVPLKLVFDALSARYFNAILRSFDGKYLSTTLFEGRIGFICPDPLGYSTSLTESNHPLTGADPKTVTEDVTGTGMVNPVYVLTAGADLGEITVILKNVTTNEELQWTGTLDTDDYLTVDVANWIARRNDVDSMATVTGQFPRLKPGANSIKVTNMAVTGVMDITYRNTYL